MRITDTAIAEVKLVDPTVHADDRGFFLESWNEATFAAAGLSQRFVQDNHSRSARGVLRGLHYQLPRAQAKLVRVVSGAAFDVAVDLRRSSPSFGRWVGCLLSAANRRMLWIPEGFAHGFLALEDDTDLLYKCTAFYAPADEQVLAWDDADVGIDWPLGGGRPRLGARDRAGARLASAATYP
jgi:dTDP-4-dehydrorhamnose 3,5-epimerase